MIKLRYDANTGLVGNGYNENIEVVEPYIIISNEEHDKIKSDEENVYFVKNGILEPQNKAEYERKLRILKMRMTPLDFIKCLESVGITYSQIKDLCNSNDEVDKQLRFCSNVYRSNNLLDAMCLQFGVTSEMLDKLFEEYGEVAPTEEIKL